MGVFGSPNGSILVMLCLPETKKYDYSPKRDLSKKVKSHSGEACVLASSFQHKQNELSSRVI